MSFFHQPKPRRFHHQYIYYDERREKLKKLEECAYSELGAENSDEGKQFRISFASDRKRNIRYRPSINCTLFMMLVVLLFLLAMFLFI